jgi:hypothetical protein
MQPQNISIVALLLLSAADNTFAQNKPSNPQTETGPITQETLDRIPRNNRRCFGLTKETLQRILELKSVPPIDRETATVLAQAYFEHVYGLCGAMQDPIETKSAWSFPCLVGIGPWPVDPILVEKATGGITCGSNESFKSSSEFLGHLTSRSTRTLPLRGTVLDYRSDFPSLPRRAASAAPVSFVR